MKNKKIIVLLFALLLITGTLFSSGQQVGTQSASSGVTVNPAGFPIVNQKINLSLFSKRNPIQGDWEKMPFWQIMEEKTNIHWTFDLVAPNALQERKNLLIASGDYPDIFYGADITINEELNYGTQGIFIRLENLIGQYGPNINKFFTDQPIYRSLSNASNGYLYTLPRLEDATRNTAASKLWINNVWLKNLGLNMPKTLDEYYNVLVAFRDKDPNQNGRRDEIPFAFVNSSLNQLRAAFLASYGVMFVSISRPFDVNANGKIFYIFTSDIYRDFLTYMNKLYAEKLLDNECFIHTDQQYVSKGNQTLLGSFPAAASYIVDSMDHYTWYSAVPPMTSARNSKQMWPATYPAQLGTFAITNKNKYPEATIRWVDYLYSPEGGSLLSQGPEGLGWFYIDNQRKMWDKTPVPTGFNSTEEYRGSLTPDHVNGPGLINRDFILGLNAAHVVNLEDQIAVAYLPYMKDSFPIIKLTEEEQREVGVLNTDIEKYVQQMEARFITGDASLSTWNNYIRDLTNMRVDRLTEIYQAAYNRFLGK